MGSMTAPVVGSMGDPACTASVPNPWTGVGERGGVSIGPSTTAPPAGSPEAVIVIAVASSFVACPAP